MDSKSKLITIHVIINFVVGRPVYSPFIWRQGTPLNVYTPASDLLSFMAVDTHSVHEYPRPQDADSNK